MDRSSTSKRVRVHPSNDESEDSDFEDILYESDITSKSERESDSETDNESIANVWSFSQEPTTKFHFLQSQE